MDVLVEGNLHSHPGAALNNQDQDLDVDVDVDVDQSIARHVSLVRRAHLSSPAFATGGCLGNVSIFGGLDASAGRISSERPCERGLGNDRLVFASVGATPSDASSASKGGCRQRPGLAPASQQS
jgi:hypothetical protein